MLGCLDLRLITNFSLSGTPLVFLLGVGGRTVSKLQSLDLHVLRRLLPDVTILKIGTKDLSFMRPKIVGSTL